MRGKWFKRAACFCGFALIIQLICFVLRFIFYKSIGFWWTFPRILIGVIGEISSYRLLLLNLFMAAFLCIATIFYTVNYIFSKDKILSLRWLIIFLICSAAGIFFSYLLLTFPSL